VAHHKQHAAKSRWTSPWLIGGAVVALGLAGGGIALAAGGSTPKSHSSALSSAPPTTTAAQAAQAAQAKAQLAAQLASSLTISPATGATGVAPNTPISITTTKGTLAGVTVANTAGTPVTGALNAAGSTWQYGGTLALSTSYVMSGQVDGPDGVSVPFHATFTTLTPTAQVTNTLYPLDGQVVGVGQPVIVHFNHSVTTAAAQAAVLAHFTVTESTPVPGGWYWFSSRELHFRPQAYWPTGEQITVSSDLTGWDVGSGMWGAGQVSVHFSIGDSHVATANLATHEMTVTNNGVTIATYPISGGSTVYPTMNGTHIAMDKESVVHMVSSTVGIPVKSPAGYDEMVYNDVHISDSGEYVHAAPWSVGAQGNTNVSHGCINLSSANSLAFFNFSQVGDVIVVTGGPRPPAVGDHGVMDWSTDWSQWTPGTVVPAAPPVTTTVPVPTTVAPASTTPSTTVAPATTTTVKP
jgi:lipoprotein-anchoring transpeptidase ErfK/SrfK